MPIRYMTISAIVSREIFSPREKDFWRDPTRELLRALNGPSEPASIATKSAGRGPESAARRAPWGPGGAAAGADRSGWRPASTRANSRRQSWSLPPLRPIDRDFGKAPRARLPFPQLQPAHQARHSPAERPAPPAHTGKLPRLGRGSSKAAGDLLESRPTGGNRKDHRA